MNLIRRDKQKSCADGALSWKLMAMMTLAFAGLALTLEAAQPPWWNARGAVLTPQVTTNSGVVTTNYVPEPMAAVNQGQLKQFTQKAVLELNANLTNGAGTNLNTMVSNWASDYATNGYTSTNPKPDDFQAIKVGQLKYIASLIDTRLKDEGYLASNPPWLATSTNDYHLANLGQLKTVFNFNITVPKVPVNVTVIPSGTQVTITWSDPSTGVTSHIIQRSTDGGVTWTTVTPSSSTSTSAIITGLTSGTSYLFRVVSTNGNGSSNPSLAASSIQLGPISNGLKLWLKADVGITQSGGNVSSWIDQSPSGIAVTQTNGIHQPAYVTNDINGKSALRFAGNQWLFNSNNLGTTAGMTMITVASTSNRSAQQYSVYLGDTSVGTSRGMGYASVVQTYSLAYDDYTGIDSPQNNLFVMEAVTLNSTKTGVVFYRNGLQTSSQNITGIQDLTSDISIGAYAGYGAPWQGDIAEVLIYDRQLNSNELQQVGIYLADKYGFYHPNATWLQSYSAQVQAEIGRFQLNKQQADAYVAILAANSPIPVSGLAAWYRADNGVATDSSGNVSYWSDQTGIYTLTHGSSGAPTYVTNDINGKPAISFSSSAQWLYNSSNIGINSGITMITVSKSSAPAQTQYSLYLGALAEGQGRSQLYLSSTEYFDGYGVGHGCPGGPALNANSFVVETTMLNADKTLVTFYQNGLLVHTGSVGGLGNIGAGIAVGSGNSNGAYWHGDIAEVLVYDHQLSSLDFQLVGVYLADKYGLYNPNANWPLQYSSEIQSRIRHNQWSKDQADNYIAFKNNNPTMLTKGLLCWLRADAGVSVISGKAAAIADQTGNFILTQSNSANQPSYIANDLNGKPGLRFSGNQWLYCPANWGTALNSDMTIISVGMITNPSNHVFGLYLGQNTTPYQNRAFEYYSGLEAFDVQYSTATGASVPAAGTFVVETAALDSSLTSVTFYQNGAQVATGSVSNLQNVKSGLTMGAATGGYVGWQGDIVEQLVYDHKLPAFELYQITLYLAQKYNLPPYATPTINIPAGSYTSTQTISITPSVSGGTVHYTLDGTTPTASSPTYTSSFSLSQSALVQALTFVSGVAVDQMASYQYYINDSGHTGLATAPGSVTVTANSAGGELDLSWTLSGQVTYSSVNLYRSTNGGAYQLVATLAPGTTSYADLNVSSGASYQYKVGTFNQSGVANSSATTATSPGATLLPVGVNVTTPSGAVSVP